MAWVAAGHENRVDARQLAEDLFPFLERRGNRRRIGIVAVHRGIPDPDVEAVVVQQARHADHHVDRRQREMGAVGIVIRPGRNQFDGVCPEDGQVANIALPLREVPGIVGIRLWSVAKLMTA